MSVQTTLLTPDLYQYFLEVSLREPPLLHSLREETQAQFATYRMQSSPEQAQFSSLLIKLMGATQAIDIGTFTGYSALAMALALPDSGQVITCEVDERPVALARSYWEKAGVTDKIKLHLAPASDTLKTLLKKGLQGHFDFVFIDADKINLDIYYEYSLELIRQGGLIAIDNVLWRGKVIDESDDRESTKKIRILNKKIHRDDRVDLSLIPIGDGLTLVRKK